MVSVDVKHHVYLLTKFRCPDEVESYTIIPMAFCGSVGERSINVVGSKVRFPVAVEVYQLHL